MAIPTRASRPGTFFITTATYNRRRLFQVPTNAELFVATLQHYRAEGHYELHAFVVMPDHIHLLLTPQAIALERAVGLIKGGFSHRFASKLPVWQRGFTDHRIRDAEDYNVRLNYLHRNPVEARLCDKPESYPFSSANPKLRLDEYLSG
jgi:putative transposase